jgi:hypothetical protein
MWVALMALSSSASRASKPRGQGAKKESVDMVLFLGGWVGASIAPRSFCEKLF